MLYWKHIPHNPCTSIIWVLYFICSMFLDWRFGSEPTLHLQLKRWNLRALQNKTHIRASILNTDHLPRPPSLQGHPQNRHQLQLNPCRQRGLDYIIGQSWNWNHPQHFVLSASLAISQRSRPYCNMVSQLETPCAMHNCLHQFTKCIMPNCENTHTYTHILLPR